MRALRRTLMLLALSVAVACGASRHPLGSPFDGAAGPDAIDLTVENNNFRDATIHVYWNGLRARAGTVIGKSTETFHMEWKSEWVQLGVGFLGGGGYETEVVPVDPGDHLHFVIMATP